MLLQVEDKMKMSLREVSLRATDAYAKIPRGEWVLQWPGQVVLAASQIHWTAEVTQVPFSLTKKIVSPLCKNPREV